MDKRMNKDILSAIWAALDAGTAVMNVYQSGEHGIELKSDQSPLTKADRLSHNVIKTALEETGIPLLSEEGKQIPYKERKSWEHFWLIDPLDGTKEFIKRNGEFTVNIAMIEKGIPIMGVVYAPVKKILYFGATGLGSFHYVIKEDEKSPEDLQQLISLSGSLQDVKPPGKYTVVASRSHLSPETEKFIEEKKHQYGEVEIVKAGSSLKLCMIAEGKATVYPRLAPTMEWDTAAGHAVAKFAGCRVYDFNTKEELRYNKEDLHNPWFVIEKI